MLKTKQPGCPEITISGSRICCLIQIVKLIYYIDSEIFHIFVSLLAIVMIMVYMK